MQHNVNMSAEMSELPLEKYSLPFSSVPASVAAATVISKLSAD